MNSIQKWFEQIAGVSLEERQRWTLAQEIFGTKSLDISALQKPACWRRNPSANCNRQLAQSTHGA